MKKCLLALCWFVFASSQTLIAAENDSELLLKVLAGQPEDVQARYMYRHPQETLEFFEVAPGMTVAEVLPGRGWYSKLLMEYLGNEGTLVGVDYSLPMYVDSGFLNEERLKAKETWAVDWPEQANGWGVENSASVNAFVFGSMPEAINGSADRVLFIRALHHLVRLSGQSDYLGEAVSNTFSVLKPGGIVGVVQHESSAEMPDDWANGKNGYLKKDFVIQQFRSGGFEYLGESDVNQNPKDQPAVTDFVWRLPPTLRLKDDSPEMVAAMNAIGESNRMTLKFRKPE